MDDHRRPRAFATFLRVYGVLLLVIFVPLLIGFIVRTPLLAEAGGPLNWMIWNDVGSGHEHAHVPPMLFTVYIVWGVFLLRAARDPLAHRSFLSFTMWANAAHALLMAAQATTDLDRYWSKFLNDVPVILILALGILFLRPPVEPGV
ncbi:DUF6632 domain-containing protein [Nonomuraea sp. NPDC048826]|uniref:DUF6632 domain-containing protein n=1 Tax=Nonomuraea sp. NPDC048826 TaxID=3364347 RepID=UPI00371DD015